MLGLSERQTQLRLHPSLRPQRAGTPRSPPESPFLGGSRGAAVPRLSERRVEGEGLEAEEKWLLVGFNPQAHVWCVLNGFGCLHRLPGRSEAG